MSWAWTLPIRTTPLLLITSPRLDPQRLRVVVPTFRDWAAARETIESLLDCRPDPREIVLVNDNSEPDPPHWVYRYPIILANYPGNRGPAHARNAGAALATSNAIDWLYFTDTGCARDRDFFARLSEHRLRLARHCVAVAGPVQGACISPMITPINSYMTEEAILNPPVDRHGPQAIVTANAAVYASAFRAVGGFDESYPFAAGEDLDIGLKLRTIGSIGWARHAVVRHRFEESREDFRKRFLRYGAGTAHLAHRLGLPCLKPSALIAKSRELQVLADIHVAAMKEGYDRHCDRLGEVVAAFTSRIAYADRSPGASVWRSLGACSPLV